MAWHASQRGAIRRPGGPAAGVPALVGPSGRAAVAVAPHPAQLHPHQQQHCVQHAAAPNDAAGAARSRRPCALGPSCRRTTVLARASQQQQPAYNPQPQQQQQQYAWPQQQPQFAAPPQQQQQVPPFGAPAQQQAPNATAALVRSRQPQPAGNAPRAVQPQQVNIEMSQVVGKQVITRTTGRNLGVISAMWVDPVQMQVVSLDLDDKKGVGATRISNFPLSRLTQIGDVVLVHDEEVLYDQPLDGRYGFYLLPGMEVRTRSGEFLGKVRWGGAERRGLGGWRAHGASAPARPARQPPTSDRCVCVCVGVRTPCLLLAACTRTATATATTACGAAGAGARLHL